MKIKYISRNEEDTDKLALAVKKILFPGSVITLDGDLGAGKTTFTKCLAKHIGVKRNVTSPTFNIMKIYEGDLKLYHLDLYRLSELGFDMDLEEYIYSDGISVVEWSRNVDSLFDNYSLRIDVKVISELVREFTIESENEKYYKLEELI